MLQLYRGNLSPKNSWELLSHERHSYIVDVRTKEEWHYVGVPDLGERDDKLIKIEWRSLPDMQLNTNFAEELASRDAANFMANLGYVNCYNILDGFEGELDAYRHRGKISGWKAEQLAWSQD